MGDFCERKATTCMNNALFNSTTTVKKIYIIKNPPVPFC